MGFLQHEMEEQNKEFNRLYGQAQFGELTLTQSRSNLMTEADKLRMQSSLDKSQASAEIHELREQLYELQQLCSVDKSQSVKDFQQAPDVVGSSPPSRVPVLDLAQVGLEDSDEPLRIEVLRMQLAKLEKDYKK